MSAMTQPTSPLDRPIAITFFRDWKAQEKQEERLSLRRLMPRLAETTKDDKKHLPWLKLARFGDERTDKKSLRHNANVLGISGIEGDYDHETATVDEACAMLRAAGLAGVIYTSPSHTEDAPRWRVLCPLSRDYDAADRASFIARLNGVFRGALSDESHTLSQSYYYGSVKRSPSHRVEIVDGDYLDRREDLDASAVGRPKNIPPVVRDAAPRAAASSAFIEAVIRGALAKVTTAGDGQKHHTLRAQAKVLGGFQHAGTYSQAEAVQWLVSALPSTAKDLKAAAKTAAWGFEWGQANPLDVPPLKNNVVPFTAPEPPPHDSIPDEPDPASPAPPVVEIEKPPPALIWFDDIRPSLDARDFVQGVLIEGTAAVVYGESNAGKTFWTTDLALHVAAGMPWNGRAVDQGGVVYCVLEGGNGFNNRVSAWRDAKGVSGIPFASRPYSLNLLNPDVDVQGLIDLIKEAAKHIAMPIKLIVVDTLARAFAGGNENASEDMGALVQNIDRIRRETGACVLFVHHSGKDQARGARGHSSLRAAVDTEIEVVADEGDEKTATIVKQRDLKKGDVFGFRLDVAVLGRDRRNEEVTTCVVVPQDADPKQPATKRHKLTKTAEMGMRALHMALDKSGAYLPALPEYPERTFAASSTVWREEFYQLKGGEPSHKRTYFSRAETELVGAGVITQRNGFVWVIKQGKHAQ